MSHIFSIKSIPVIPKVEGPPFLKKIPNAPSHGQMVTDAVLDDALDRAGRKALDRAEKLRQVLVSRP